MARCHSPLNGNVDTLDTRGKPMSHNRLLDPIVILPGPQVQEYWLRMHRKSVYTSPSPFPHACMLKSMGTLASGGL